MRGYFLLAIVRRQSASTESWVDSSEARTGAHSICWPWVGPGSIAKRWKSPPCVAIRLPGAPSEECGFHHRASCELHLLDCSKRGLPGVGLRVQMMEGDAAYLDDGGGSLWA